MTAEVKIDTSQARGEIDDIGDRLERRLRSAARVSSDIRVGETGGGGGVGGDDDDGEFSLLETLGLTGAGGGGAGRLVESIRRGQLAFRIDAAHRRLPQQVFDFAERRGRLPGRFSELFIRGANQFSQFARSHPYLAIGGTAVAGAAATLGAANTIAGLTPDEGELGYIDINRQRDLFLTHAPNLSLIHI